MEKKQEHFGGHSFRDFGKLNHYMTNLYSRDENHDDVIGLGMELKKLIPGYAENVLEVKHRLNESAT